MEIETFADLLLLVASIAVVVIALALVIAAYAVYHLVERVERLIRSVQGEFEVLKDKRKRIEVNGRTVFKLAKWAALFMLRRRIF